MGARSSEVVRSRPCGVSKCDVAMYVNAGGSSTPLWRSGNPTTGVIPELLRWANKILRFFLTQPKKKTQVMPIQGLRSTTALRSHSSARGVAWCFASAGLRGASYAHVAHVAARSSSKYAVALSAVALPAFEIPF